MENTAKKDLFDTEMSSICDIPKSVTQQLHISDDVPTLWDLQPPPTPQAWHHYEDDANSDIETLSHDDLPPSATREVNGNASLAEQESASVHQTASFQDDGSATFQQRIGTLSQDDLLKTATGEVILQTSTLQEGARTPLQDDGSLYISQEASSEQVTMANWYNKQLHIQKATSGQGMKSPGLPNAELVQQATLGQQLPHAQQAPTVATEEEMPQLDVQQLPSHVLQANVQQLPSHVLQAKITTDVSKAALPERSPIKLGNPRPTISLAKPQAKTSTPKKLANPRPNVSLNTTEPQTQTSAPKNLVFGLTQLITKLKKRTPMENSDAIEEENPTRNERNIFEQPDQWSTHTTGSSHGAKKHGDKVERRGRPKGSKNKKTRRMESDGKVSKNGFYIASRKRGRPKGSKNTKRRIESDESEQEDGPSKRNRTEIVPDGPAQNSKRVRTEPVPMSLCNLCGYATVDGVHIDKECTGGKTQNSESDNIDKIRVEMNGSCSNSNSEVNRGEVRDGDDSSSDCDDLEEDVPNYANEDRQTSSSEEISDMTDSGSESELEDVLKKPNAYKKHVTDQSLCLSPSYKCKYCDLSWMTREYLIKHEKTHTLKTYTCKKCGKDIPVEDRIKHNRLHAEHMPSKNDLDNLYQCQVCDYKASSMLDILSHQNEHNTPHSADVEDEERTNALMTESSTKEKNKRAHKGVHKTKENDAQKVTSSKSKNSVTQMGKENGKITHRPVKKSDYQCRFCDKSLSNPYSLERHERIHTGEMPFSCSLCNRKYSDQSNRKFHEQKCKEHFNKTGKFYKGKSSSKEGQTVGKPSGKEGQTVGKPSGKEGQTVGKPSGKEGQTVGKTSGKEGQAVGKSLSKEGQAVGKSSGKEGQTVGKSSGKVGQTVGKPSGKEGQTVGKPSGKEGQAVGKSSGKEGQTVGKSLSKEGQAVGKSSGKEGQTVGKSSGKEGQTVGKPSGKEGQAVGKSSGKEGQTVGKSLTKEGQTVGKSSGKEGQTVGKSSGKEGEAVGKPSGTEGKAVGKSSGKEGQTVGKSSGKEGQAVGKPSSKEGQTVGKSSGKEGQTVGKSSGKEGQAVGKSSGKEGQTVGKSSGKEGQTVGKSSGKEGQTVGKSSGKEGQAVGKSSGKEGQTVGKSSGKEGQAVGKSSGKVGQTVGKSSGKEGQTVGKSSDKVGQTVGKSSGKEGQTVGKSSGKEGQTVGNSSRKEGQTVVKSSSKEGQTVGKSSGKEDQTVGKPSGKKGQTVGKSSGEVGQTVGKSSGKEDQTIGKPSGKKGQTVGKSSGKVGQTVGKSSGKEGQTVGKSSGKEGQKPDHCYHKPTSEGSDKNNDLEELLMNDQANLQNIEELITKLMNKYRCSDRSEWYGLSCQNLSIISKFLKITRDGKYCCVSCRQKSNDDIGPVLKHVCKTHGEGKKRTFHHRSNVKEVSSGQKTVLDGDCQYETPESTADVKDSNGESAPNPLDTVLKKHDSEMSDSTDQSGSDVNKNVCKVQKPYPLFLKKVSPSGQSQIMVTSSLLLPGNSSSRSLLLPRNSTDSALLTNQLPPGTVVLANPAAGKTTGNPVLLVHQPQLSGKATPPMDQVSNSGLPTFRNVKSPPPPVLANQFTEPTESYQVTSPPPPVLANSGVPIFRNITSPPPPVLANQIAEPNQVTSPPVLSKQGSGSGNVTHVVPATLVKASPSVKTPLIGSSALNLPIGSSAGNTPIQSSAVKTRIFSGESPSPAEGLKSPPGGQFRNVVSSPRIGDLVSSMMSSHNASPRNDLHGHDDGENCIACKSQPHFIKRKDIKIEMCDSDIDEVNGSEGSDERVDEDIERSRMMEPFKGMDGVLRYEKRKDSVFVSYEEKGGAKRDAIDDEKQTEKITVSGNIKFGNFMTSLGSTVEVSEATSTMSPEREQNTELSPDQEQSNMEQERSNSSLSDGCSCKYCIQSKDDGAILEECDKCGEQYTNKILHDLTRHLSYKLKRRFTCKTCKQVFNKKCDVIIHERSMHHDLEAYRCSQCFVKFPNASFFCHEMKCWTEMNILSLVEPPSWNVEMPSKSNNSPSTSSNDSTTSRVTINRATLQSVQRTHVNNRKELIHTCKNASQLPDANSPSVIDIKSIKEMPQQSPRISQRANVHNRLEATHTCKRASQLLEENTRSMIDLNSTREMYMQSLALQSSQRTNVNDRQEMRHTCKRTSQLAHANSPSVIDAERSTKEMQMQSRTSRLSESNLRPVIGVKKTKDIYVESRTSQLLEDDQQPLIDANVSEQVSAKLKPLETKDDEWVLKLLIRNTRGYFYCKTCKQKAIPSRQEVIQHIQLRHGGKERVFQCKYCSQQFKTRTSWSRHLQDEHEVWSKKRKHSLKKETHIQPSVVSKKEVRTPRVSLNRPLDSECSNYNEVFPDTPSTSSHEENWESRSSREESSNSVGYTEKESSPHRSSSQKREPGLSTIGTGGGSAIPKRLIKASNKCRFCPKTFNSELKLSYHEIIKHGFDSRKNDAKQHSMTVDSDKPASFLAKSSIKKSQSPLKTNSGALHSPGSSANFKCKDTDHKDSGKFKCNYCCDYFTNKDMQRHLKLHQRGDLKSACQYCGKLFVGVNNLKRHERIHTGEKPYHCSFCGMAFSDGGNWRKHEKRHREREKRRKGNKHIGAATKMKVNINNNHAIAKTSHSKIRNNDSKKKNKTVVIEEKPEYLKNSVEIDDKNANISDHIEITDSGTSETDLTMQSLKQNESFTDVKQSKQLIADTKKLLGNDGLNMKVVVPKLGSDNSQLADVAVQKKLDLYKSKGKRRGKIENGVRLYECSFCGKYFPNLYQIDRHERIHTGERPFHCTSCKKEYSDKSNCMQHQRRCINQSVSRKFVKKEKTQLSKGKKTVPSTKTKFKCQLCKRQFLNYWNLRRHEKTNSHKEKFRSTDLLHKKFRCQPCKMGFSCQASLERHMKTNSHQERQEKLRSTDMLHKKFRCRLCKMGFTCQTSLDRHIKTASHQERLQNKDLFICIPCNVGFPWQSDMKRHKESQKHKKMSTLYAKKFQKDKKD